MFDSNSSLLDLFKKNRVPPTLMVYQQFPCDSNHLALEMYIDIPYPIFTQALWHGSTTQPIAVVPFVPKDPVGFGPLFLIEAPSVPNTKCLILQPQPQKRIKKLDGKNEHPARPSISMKNRLKTAAELAELPVFPNFDVVALRLTMALRVGPDPWTEYHAAIGEPLELQVPDGGLALQVLKKGMYWG